MLRGWISSKKAELTSSGSAHSLGPVSEPQSLEDAMRAANFILNDDLDGAEKGLEGGNSSFHKLGKGMIAFLRATLGFEPEVMREASERLAEAEAGASNDHRRAQKDPQTFKSTIYNPGAEFALCHAESQLMSAVVAVLSESLTESIKGFYKLRKAYVTLDSIIESEHRHASNMPQLSRTNTRRSSLGAGDEFDHFKAYSRPATAPSTKPPSRQGSVRRVVSTKTDDDSDDDAFEDAAETQGQNTSHQSYEGHLEMDGVIHKLEETSLSQKSTQAAKPKPPARSSTKESLSSYFSPAQLPTKQVLSHAPDSEVFASPIDVFVHSGTNLCFGMLLLLISLIPPAFGKLLYIIGFNGDRERGLRMMWQSSRFHNINGAMAGLVLLGYYNGLVGYCDILPDTSTDQPLDSADNIEGYPVERLERLLKEMRRRYPQSKLWLLEEARMKAAKGQLDEGIALLSGDTQSPLKQVHALSVFERSLQAMYAHKYEICSASFQECTTLNNWSHALYLYIAGSAHVELYRSARAAGDTKAAAAQAEKATELLQNARKQSGKKRFMARPLPFDLFVVRKLDKWEHRAKDWGVSFMDAIGVSPLEEMIYFWNGHKKMDSTQLSISLEKLAWSSNPDRNPTWMHEGLDEKAILTVLRAATYRRLQQFDKAKDLLKSEVLCHDRALFKGPLKDDWTCPTAHYEMAANSWQQRDHGGEQGTSRNRELVGEAEKWLETVSKWESYTLDARIGMKVTTGIDTVKTWKAQYDR